MLDELPLTATLIGCELLPQATRNPASTSAKKRLPTIEYFNRLRPAKPARTIPAKGRVIGNHGSRFSARRRCCLLGLPVFEFGPLVVIVTVSVTGLGVPAVIAGPKLQVTVVSGRPLQAKVTLSAK